MVFSENSLRFLDENHRRNNRDWFIAHKEEYEEHVRRPMLELAGALIPTLLRIDPLLVLEPRRAVCRIYRDTRFSRDKTMFKRASWFVFQRSRGMVHPVWFFEFTPDFHHFGCGYYSAPPRVMARVRELVLAGDRRYHEAQAALDAASGFTLEGDLYRRPRHPDAPSQQRDWLERKSVTALSFSRDTSRLFSKNLASRLAAAFRGIAPVYSFLMHAHESAGEENASPRRAMRDDREVEDA